MNSRRWLAVIAFASLLIGAVALYHFHSASRKTGAMPEQAYVWQRAWTPAVRTAVRDSSQHLSAYVVLAADVLFRNDRIDVARVPLDYPSLATAGIPIGLALRIGPFHGSFAADDATANRLTDLAASIIAEATAAGVRPAELQIDFDCAESKLDGYRTWIEAIKRRVAPVPVTITALPAWLSEPAFSQLARATGGYVLQVHSLQRPTSIGAPMTLCDAQAARRWVEQAGRIGVAFRVALPTYGYLVAFDENGMFRGLSAEGPSLDWPAGTQIRVLRSDPAVMADLVAGWNADRPACMAGIIWYRLPVADDSLNWRWTTLQSVMAGQPPRANLRATVVESEPKLFEVQLLNDGQADAVLDSAVTVRWNGAAVVASDALGGFESAERGQSGISTQKSDTSNLKFEMSSPKSMTFRPSPALAGQRLAPGDRRAVAWLRLGEDKEVHADVSKQNP